MQGQSFSRLAQKLVARIESGLRCGWKETAGQDLIEYTLMAGWSPSFLGMLDRRDE
jgi:hypothetical protein